jgi:hypothetical protein
MTVNTSLRRKGFLHQCKRRSTQGINLIVQLTT